MKGPVAGLILSVFVFSISASGEIAAEYFPLAVGNTWVMHVDTIEETYRPATNTIVVTKTEAIGDQTYFKRVNTMRPDNPSLQDWTGHVFVNWERAGENGILLGAGSTGGSDTTLDKAPILDPPIPFLPDSALTANHAWSYDFGSGSYSFSVACTTLARGDVTVPAGSFTNCLRIKQVYYSSSNLWQWNIRSFARGVGEVKLECWNEPWKQFAWVLTSKSVQSSAARKRIVSHASSKYSLRMQSSSVVKFTLPDAADVELILFDMTGRVAARFINKSMNAGEYSQEITGGDNDIPRGAYVIQLNAGTYVSVKPWICTGD